jgi:starch-binding outer membrane protein, SusD/RagB family
MKNKIFITALIASFFFSCQSDLNFANPDSSTIEEAFKTETGANASLVGIYSRAQSEFNLNGIPQLLGEWQSDNVAFRGTFPTYIDFRDYITLSDNGSVFSIWDAHYEMIGQANIVIAKTNSCPDPNFTQAEKDNNIGQAKFIRALANLQLLNLFSQPVQLIGANSPGIPLVIDLPSGIGKDALPRATIGMVYKQIEVDLNDAILKITNTNRSRVTVDAAKALLARVYLYQDKFNEAADFANQVIVSGKSKLGVNYDFYNKPDDQENIFTLVNLANDAQNGGTSFSRMTNPVQIYSGRGDCPFSANLSAAFIAEVGDLRYNIKQPDPQSATRLFTTKFINAPADFAADAPIIRITEMYLIRAEANLKASSSVGDTPLNDINKLRQRAGLTNVATVDINRILLERRKELCFEGFRRMDLLRNNLPLRSAGLPQSAVSAPGADKVILPIPQREIDLSIGKVLKQNTGY